jgi:sugar O-acyltransferase (sialic acid O-acetyltransferase NeuD family)
VLVEPEPVELVIIGSGGFSRETAEAVRSAIDHGAAWLLKGFVDDDSSRIGTLIDGLQVLGSIDSVSEHPAAKLVIGTGRPDNYWSRLRIAARLGIPLDRYATLVHPDASISASTSVGYGTVLLAGVVATASVRVGDHVAVMPGVILTHDDVIDDYATITAGVRLGGGVRIGEGAYVGSGALVREGVSIGPWAMVGMGSLVARDVPAGELWVGAPAHYLRPAPAPADLIHDAMQRRA